MALTGESLIDTLNAVGTIVNQTIDFSGQTISIRNLISHDVEFLNCHIIAHTLQFIDLRNEHLIITFDKCTIDARLRFENCIMDGVVLSESKALKALDVTKGYNHNSTFEANYLKFMDKPQSDNILDADIHFSGCKFKDEFSIYGIKHTGGIFEMLRNDFGVKDGESENFNFNFQKATFNKIWLFKNNFYNLLSITESSFLRNSNDLAIFQSFVMNNFNKIYLKKSVLENEHFVQCEFEEISYFEDLQSQKFSIIDCVFNKYSSFNNSIINDFSLKRLTFINSASFQETLFEKIFIDKVNFEKGAYFDDLKINVNQCDRRTLRNIKQQLQKAENKIDYNRFRNYELSAYYAELKWEADFKDKFILWATKWSTGFEHSWRRALGFTLLIASLFYSLFFISENYMLDIKLSNWKEFISGYFRFLLVTDFYNPLSNGRKYIDNTNTIGWFIFVFGKIVIAFGVYEMIQAFRKFKA